MHACQVLKQNSDPQTPTAALILQHQYLITTVYTTTHNYHSSLPLAHPLPTLSQKKPALQVSSAQYPIPNTSTVPVHICTPKPKPKTASKKKKTEQLVTKSKRFKYQKLLMQKKNQKQERKKTSVSVQR